VVELLSSLLDIPQPELRADRTEVDAFGELSPRSMAGKLVDGCSRAQIEALYLREFPTAVHEGTRRTRLSLFAPRPDEWKVARIAQSLEFDHAGLGTRGEGLLSLQEVQRLFGILLGIPEEEVPPTHREVVEFIGLSPSGVVDKLRSISNRQATRTPPATRTHHLTASTPHPPIDKYFAYPNPNRE